jgi:hypothetical protein
MQPTDHKAVLRALAAVDGCQASLKAAAHIEYLERQLTSARDYQEQLRRRLAKTRHQRDELKRKLMGEEHVGSNWNDDSYPDRSAGVGCHDNSVLSGVEGSVQ